MGTYRILLVDDDPLVLKSMKSALEDHGYTTDTVNSGEEAVEALGEKSYDLIITDLVMAGVDGIKVLKSAKSKDPGIKVILLTAYGSIESTIDALRLKADDFLLKPCASGEIFFRVKQCFEKLELEKKVKIYEKILPVCCECKKIRDDEGREPGTGRWLSIEKYFHDKIKIDISHTLCPECLKKYDQMIDD